MRKIFIFVLVILIAFYTSTFIVEEGQRGIMMRFGKVLRNDNNQPLVYMPGLHFKIPLLESVKSLDARIQTMDNQADRFVTKEQKDLIVDSYIKWCVSDFSRYYLATGGGDISQAEVLLKRKFSDRLRSEIGRLDVQEIVNDFSGRLTTDVRDALNTGSSDQDHFGAILPINQNSMAELGIKVIDVRIKQINLPTEVSDAIYARMRAERESVARSQRARGAEEAAIVRAQADYEVEHTLAEARREALITRGEGDAEVAKLFSSIFSQDPDFYVFLRSLRAYDNSFSSTEDVLILSPDSNFFRFMQNPKMISSQDKMK
ncbi:Modulator of FtsH protease HflC [Candidatus Erwinia haradaeae]|uniref:Protein HflC n=1 Tax=Candidatus Erwinia haradaeae TaxID=1922217 RepID=A0A451CZI3_9GAMM|nr:protease modulator HflC [Candidatus Erwinia haradaeae]VFP78790.1 Modulator of FtsH protease HflC [Candidatus Erwinia haradaeae]